MHKRVSTLQSLEARVRKLAAAAKALKSLSGVRDAPFSLAFMSDPRRGPRAMDMGRVLPPGSALIFRHYDAPNRADLAGKLAALSGRQGFTLMIGADPSLARHVGAGGVHLRSDQLGAPPEGVAGLIVSAACHSVEDLRQAAAIGADVAVLSPVFPTASHPGADALGLSRFRAMAESAPMPVLALGGVDETNAAGLGGPNVIGFAAIGAFSAP